MVRLTTAETSAAPERPDGPVPVISPLVRRLARENGLDLRKLNGTGPEGLILRSDVEHALRAATAPVQVPQAVTAQPVAAPVAQPAPAGAPPPPASPSVVSGAPSPTSSPAAGARFPTRPAGWTPTRRS